MVETLPNMRAIEVEIVEPIGFFRAFATQSNMKGRFCRETWYGFHSVWLRILLFILFTSFLYTLQEALDVPFIKVMSDVELQEMRDVHSSCLRSFCDVARDIPPIDCIVGRDGHSAYMDIEAYNGPRDIPFPHSCHLAMQKTFGLDPLIYDLIHIRNGTALLQALSQLNLMEPFFLIHHETCTFTIPGSGSIGTMLIDAPEPGQRQQNLFERYVCEDELSDSDSGREYLALFHARYEWILTYRFIVYFTVSFAAGLIGNLCDLGLLMIHLIPSTFVLRLILRWPKDFVGYRQVTFWSIWQTLVLICVVTSYHEGWGSLHHYFLALSLILGSRLGAYQYGGKKALLEWGSLYLLFITQSSWTTVLADLLNKLAMFNGLLALGQLVHLVIPGEGWWKLVRVYAFCLSYSSLWKKMDDPLPPVQEAQQNGGEAFQDEIPPPTFFSDDTRMENSSEIDADVVRGSAYRRSNFSKTV
jgi:hypothetical protein